MSSDKLRSSPLFSAGICFALAPLLNRWMHPEADTGRKRLPEDLDLVDHLGHAFQSGDGGLANCFR